MLNAGTLGSYAKGLQTLLDHPRIEHLAGHAQQGRQAQPQLFKADVNLLIDGDEVLQAEVFGPTTVVVEVADQAQLSAALHGLHGQLTATIIGEQADFEQFSELTGLLEQKVGRILLNGYPTGVEVCDSMVHGGPYPATSDARGTSVGTLAIDRFLRPVCFLSLRFSHSKIDCHDCRYRHLAKRPRTLRDGGNRWAACLRIRPR
ncbi:Alpha-ketoglutaric semialdehyde dehydrogenase [compost metagenome]